MSGDHAVRLEPGQSIRNMPTPNLAIALQKIAKDVSHFKPGYRVALLEEAARRLNEYRSVERSAQLDALMKASDR